MAPNPTIQTNDRLITEEPASIQEFDLFKDELEDELESDEPPLESDQHRELIDLLLACLHWWWRDRPDFYATGNLTIYYNRDRLTNRDFRGPDFFVVLGAKKRRRKSWMVWRENNQYPHVIVEFLSDSTAQVDRTTKKILYQDTFQTPEYFWFHPDTQEFAGFRLIHNQYEPIAPNVQGWRWSEQLQLYLGIHQEYLRLWTPDGTLIPSPEERATEAEQKATEAEQKATEAQQKATQAEQKATQAEQNAVQEQQKAIQAQQKAVEAAQQLVQAEQQALQARQEALQAEQQTAQVQQEAEQAKRELAQAQARSQQLAALLRSLGIDPDQMPGS